MGSCPSFFKYSPHSQSQSVSEPSLIKLPDRFSEGSIINPQNLHIDIIVENELLPANLLGGSRKKDTEISLDSPTKSPKV